MNRLMHLRKTLPESISGNGSYPAIEFVILDYNSQDGMEDWARTHLAREIADGRVNYYKTCEPRHFDRSHAKNLACKLATGDIVCLLDADNYAGRGYADWVSSAFRAHGDDTIITTLRKDCIPFRDQGGKLCFLKERFEAVRGFNEGLDGYGVEDVDLVERLEQSGGKRVFIEKEEFLRFIEHSDLDRLRNHSLFEQLVTIYVPAYEPANTTRRFLFLRKNNTCFEVNTVYNEALRGNPVAAYHGWTIARNGINHGSWAPRMADVHLAFDKGSELSLRNISQGIYSSQEERKTVIWNEVSKGESRFYELMMAYEECFNRSKREETSGGNGGVNPNGWGKATVYLNFDMRHPMTIG